MNDISLDIAVSFGNYPKTYSQMLLEAADDYFYWGGRKACVIPGHLEGKSEGVILTDDFPKASFLITALKVISYFTGIIPAIAYLTRVLMRRDRQYHVIDLEKELSAGIIITDKMKKKVQDYYTVGLPPGEVEKYSSGMKTQVYSFTKMPRFVFKVTEGDRFGKSVKALETCLVNNLDLLVIPPTNYFTMELDGRKFQVIVEKKLPIQQDRSRQDYNYEKLSGLGDSVEQIALFIAKTGLSDINRRNIPVLDHDPKFLGRRRIALIDLEAMGSPQEGFWGGGIFAPSDGLIISLSQGAHLVRAQDVADKFGIKRPY